ncbi:hypothetical protein EDD15DRAFT_2362864 [Pisolithus albus]|nr:hypothetical protein EDD15DRAFT_2362864 [Pisolithus albus]
MLHLKSPLEKWDYLEKHFGSIPRPDSWLVVEEAMQRGNLLPKQDAAEETAHPHGDNDNEPANLPEGSSEALEPQEDPAESPDDCAETKSGYLTPKTEVMDAWQVELDLPVVEVGSMDSEWLDEHANAFEAPEEGGQCTSTKVEESWDLPELSSKALKLDVTPPDWLVVTLSKVGHYHPSKRISPPGCTATNQSSTYLIHLNDPKETGSTLGEQTEEPKRSSQLRETERPGPHRDHTPEGKFRIYEGWYTWDTPPDKVWGMGVRKRARVGMGDSRDVELIMTKLEIRPNRLLTPPLALL